MHLLKMKLIPLLFALFFTTTLSAQEAAQEEKSNNDPNLDCEERTYSFEHSRHGSGVICGEDCEKARANGMMGVWLPESPILYRPYLADPRQITYSAGWRFNDQALGAQNVIDVSYGDNCAIYRWCDVNIGPLNGQLQFEIEGALWAVFAPLERSAPLINADYYVGFPITFASGNWAFKIRGYHISSHIGDEYLIEHPEFVRKNPSAEYLEFAVSNDFTDEIRYYGSVGWIVHQDPSFKFGRWYADAGMEVRLPRFGFEDARQDLYGEPFYAFHWRYFPIFKRHLDMTYVIGYEIGKTSGLCRKLRVFLEYHDGYSAEGQFAKMATNYVSLRVSYGF